VKLLRAVLGRLDAWAALLLGVLVALAVVILLALPGPWHKAVRAGAGSRSSPPSDVAVFASGAPAGTCNSIVWLHITDSPSAVTAVVIAPDTQGFVPGAGLTPLRRVVDEAGPAAAAASLGRTVGVPMDAWIALDRQALRLVTGPMLPPGEGRIAQVRLRLAGSAWETVPTAPSWRTQYAALQQGLPRIDFKAMSVVSFANYILGFGHVQSDLSLRTATSIATTLEFLSPARTQVRATDAIVQTCRGGAAWHLDDVQLAQLRQWLAFGLAPPDRAPAIHREAVPARVLVVLPGPLPHSGAYVAEVSRRLRLSAGAPVAVRLLAVPDWSQVTARTAALVHSWRPLAVLVGPPGVRRADAGAAAAAALRDLATLFRGARQPAVFSSVLPPATESASASSAGTSASSAGGSPAPGAQSAATPGVQATATPGVPASLTPAATASPGGSAATAAAAATAAIGQALVAAALPVSPLNAALLPQGAGVAAATARVRAAADANVATLVRACWPGTLAPRLASTRRGFWFVARRRTTVGIVEPAVGAARTAARLHVWGYRTREPAGVGWRPALAATSVYYRSGRREAAMALAGDLGLRPAAVIADDSAPAGVTLYRAT